MGSPENAIDRGAVYILLGNDVGGLIGSQIVRSSGSATGDRFGAELVVGDFNGTTWGGGHRLSMLAVGAPRNDTPSSDAGRVYIWKPTFTSGVYQGLTQSWNAGQAIPGGTNAASDHFGAVLAAGDLNGDGFDDLVSGMPDKDVITTTDAG